MVADVALPPPPTGGNFTLDGPSGPVALHDFSGKVVLLYFGYTYCPDICPTSLAVWQQALDALTPGELAQVQPLFVSVDPERDSIERLAEYAQFFHPRIVALTGRPATLAEIAGRYGAVFVRQESASAGGYVIDHSALTYVIDPQGRLVDALPHGASAEQLLAVLRKHFSSN
jgi:protein SCO1/2